MILFNLAAINFAWLPILPLMIVAVGAMVVLLVGVRVNDSESEGLGWLRSRRSRSHSCSPSVLVGQNGVAFAGALSIDNFAAFF